MSPTNRRARKKASGSRETPVQRRVREERETVYRHAINEAAERIFAEKGADGSRMNEIASEAGIGEIGA